jgi:hypothetical protein
MAQLLGHGDTAGALGAGSPEQRQRRLHALQRTAGNATVNRMLSKATDPPAAPDSPAARDSPASPTDPDAERLAQRLGPGRPLDPAVGSRMGAALGADLGSVRIHEDAASASLTRSRGARAVAVGEHVAFAPNQYQPGTALGDALIAHELAHVVQQSDGPTVARAMAPDAQLEADADRSAVGALQVLHGGASGRRGLPALRSGLRLQRCGGDPHAWDKTNTITDAAGAHKAAEAYLKMDAKDRRAAVKATYNNDLPRLLQLIPTADQIGKYNDALAEIGRTVEEEETRAAAGMGDVAIANVQFNFIKKQAEDAAAAAAKAKLPKDAPPPPPPTEAEVETERKKKVESVSIPQPPPPPPMTDAEKAAWHARGVAAVDKVVEYAKKHHPELGITKANFDIAFDKVQARGANVVAAGSPAQIGYAFVRAVEADPAYVMDVVVHEVFGHPGYGAYGSEYHLAIYDKAMESMPGYHKPAEGSTPRRTELDAYAYQETEIYAVLRGSPYRTAPRPADVAKVPPLDPKGLVTWHLNLMNDTWAPILLVPIVRGLRKRLVVDPRITGGALAIFDESLKASKINATKVAEIVK